MAPEADALVVRPYAPGDRLRLLELLRQVWSYKRDVDRHVNERWWWQRAEPPLFVAEDPASNKLVGLCAYIPCVIRSQGHEASCAWFVDFYVLASHQGRGLGKRLTQAVQERFDVTASLSQTAMAYRVFHKLGWSERSAVRVLLHPMPKRWMFPDRSPGCRTEVAAIGAALPKQLELDQLWASLQDAYPLIARRSSTDLVQRYAAQPSRQYTLITAFRGQECVGYMIVRVVRGASERSRAPQGLIVDGLTHPGDTAAFGALLGEAAAVLTGEGVTRMFCLSTFPEHQALLGSRGFLSPETPLLGRLMKGNTKWLTCVTSADAAWANRGDWYLTLGDCDIDYAWLVD